MRMQLLAKEFLQSNLTTRKKNKKKKERKKQKTNMIYYGVYKAF